MFPSACFMWGFVTTFVQKDFFASSLSSSKHGLVGLIFTDEEQKKWAHDVSVVYDVTDTDCWAQKGHIFAALNDGTHGHIFAALNDSTHGHIFAALNDSTHGHIFAALNDSTHGHIFEALSDSTHGHIFEALNDGTHGHIFEALNDSTHGHIFGTSNICFFKQAMDCWGWSYFCNLKWQHSWACFFASSNVNFEQTGHRARNWVKNKNKTKCVCFSFHSHQ